jgi:hypothetical protein
MSEITSLKLNLNISPSWNVKTSNGISETQDSNTNFELYKYILGSGLGTSGSGMSNQMFVVSGTISGTDPYSNSNTYDLTSGMENPFGQPINFSEIKFLMIKNTTSGANVSDALYIGAADSDAFLGWFPTDTDIEEIMPGDISIKTAYRSGYETSATEKNIKVLYLGSGVATYELVIAGIDNT